MHTHHHNHSSATCVESLEIKERKTRIVVGISFATMIAEIVFGYLTNSMALLSDGWHMSAHVLAIGASWLTYKYVLKKKRNEELVNGEKILSVAGLVNALLLMVVAFFVIAESLVRFCSPLPIDYQPAILVALLGLVVNLLSAKILHHDSTHTDHNIQATYLHILSDVLTSLLAIIALLVGLYFGFYKADAVVGMIGSLVIIYWAWGIIKNSWSNVLKSS
jgi:cation diffusion facilitator family transporter